MQYKLFKNGVLVGYSDMFLSNYECVEMTEEEILELQNKDFAFERIEELKALLANEDFKTIKFIQGKLSQEEFALVVEQCDAWRNEINELEAKYGII